MNVCKCMNIEYAVIKQAVTNFGSDINTISNETGAGTACGCCLNNACRKVELPLPSAIAKAIQE